MRSTFENLAASRKQWIEEVLKPWCRSASLNDLRKAEGEWEDIAGRVDPESTLWTWAWSRFPELVHDGLAGVDETYPVEVRLADGTVVIGYPDNVNSSNGRLSLLCSSASLSGAAGGGGPYSIDDVESVVRISAR